MAQADRKVLLKDAGQELLRQAIHPLFLLYIVLGLTMPWWRMRVVYILLWTRLFDPAGVIQWSVLLLCASCFVAGIGTMLYIAGQRSGPIAQARKCWRARDMDGWQRLKPLARAQQRRAMLYGWIAFLMVYPSVPGAAAIALGDEFPMLVKDHGKLRYGTHEEQIHSMLRTLERM